MSLPSLNDQSSDYYKYLKYKKGDIYSLSNQRAEKDWVWVPHPEKAFVLAEKTSEAGDTVTVRSVDGEELKVKKAQIHGVNPIKFDGAEDCSALSHLNEPAVYRNLSVRYDDDLIYTYSGLFLVAMNPYKRIPIYTPTIVELYKGRRRNEIAPHIFAVSDGAYRSMLADRQDQAILITGESGAGKTENTKKVIQYFATVAGHVTADHVGTLEQQILEANPILEAFGNAKTLKNDNSSRFGKFIRLQFNAGGVIQGASIQSYLLERNRVVFQAKGERSFHIFYQLTMGATSEERDKYKLAAPEAFHFTAQSGCSSVPGMNEREELEHTKEAMAIMGVSDAERDSIFKTVSAILHLGNLPFENSAGDQAVLSDRKELDIAASLLNVDANQLDLALCKPRIRAGRDIVQTSLSAEKARYSRDALVKALYGRLFLWIVKRINESIAKDRSTYFIGVLDIAGFEIFEHNSFEQICINYTNEKLQQFFNNHMFKLEQEEYMREKINWTFIDFGMDSQDRIDLIEKKPIGILPLLEEECFFPKATDDTFLAKLNGAHSRNAYFKKPKFVKGTFRLSHYAGEVEYTIAGWLDKNKDPLQDDLQLTMKQSKDGLVASLFSDEFGWQLTGPSAASKSTNQKSSGASGGLSSVSKNPKNLGANFVTVSMAYKEQLTDLMDTLGATNPHFVRCIIPNHAKQPGHLVMPLILEQLRCNGVLEGIRISRKGFPNRVVYSDFVKRYYILCKDVTRDPPDTRAATEKVINHLKLDPEQLRYGLTKIFFRQGQLAIIEEQREKRIAEMLLSVQAGVRGWIGRRTFYKLKTRSGAAKIIQRNLRCWLDFKTWLWWTLFTKAKPLIKRTDLNKEIERLSKELAEQQSVTKAAAEATAKVVAELAALQKSIEELKSKLKSEKESSSELQGDNAKLEKLKAELEAREAELVKKVNESSGASKALIQAKRAALDLVKELGDKLEAERRQKKDLEAVKAANADKIRELEGQLEGSNDSIERFKKAEQALETEINELSAMLDTEKKNVSNLHAQLREAQQQQGNLAADYDQLVSANAGGAKQRKALEDELAEVRDALDKEKALRAAEESKGRDLQTQYDTLMAKHTQGSTKGGELARVKAQLEAELQEVRDKLDASQERRYALEKSKKKLEADLDELRDKLNEEAIAKESLDSSKRKRESELEELRRQLDAANLKITQLEKLKATLEAQIVELKAGLEKEQAARANAEKNRKKLESDVDEVRRQLDNEVKERLNLEKTNKKLANDVRDAKQLADDEKKAREELDRGNKSLEGDLAVVQEFIASGGDAAATLEREKKLLEVKVDDLRAQLDNAAEYRFKAEKQKKDAEDALASLRDKLHDSEDRLEALTSAKRKLDAELADVKKRLEDSSDQKAKNEQAAKNMQAQIAELRTQVETEQAAKARLERDRKKSEDAVDEWEQKLRHESAERIKLQKLIEKFDNEIKTLRRKGVGELEHSPEAVTKLELDLGDLKDQLEAEQALRASLEKSKRALENDLKDLNDQLEDALAAKARVDKARRDLEEVADDLKNQLEKSGSNDVLETIRQKHAADLDELRRKYEYEAETRARYESAKKQLAAEGTDTRDQIEEEQRQRGNIERTRKKAETDQISIKEQLESAINDKNKTLREMRKAEKALKEEKIRIAVGPKGGDSEEVRKLQGQLNDLKDQVQRAQSNKSNDERRGRTLADEIAGLKSEIDLEAAKSRGGAGGIEQQIKDLQKELEELEEARDAAEESKKAVDADVDRLKKEIDAAQMDKKRAEERTRTLGVDADKTKKLLDDEKRGKADAERAKRRFESDLDDVRARLATETSNKEKAEKAKKKAEKEVKEATKRLNEREAQKADAEKKVFKQTQELEQNKARFDQTQKEIDSLSGLIKNQLEAQIEAINDQIDAEKKARIRADKMRRDLEGECEELKESIEEEENSKAGKDNVLSALRSQRDEHKKTLDFEIANRDRAEDAKKELDREIITLKLKLESANKDRTNNEAKKAEREDELVIIKSNLEEESKLREKAEKALEKAEKELAESQAELMASGTKTGDEGKEVARLDGEVKNLRDKVEEDIKKKKEAESDKRKLEDQITMLKDKIRRIEDSLAKARDDTANEKKQKAKLEERLAAILGAAI